MAGTKSALDNLAISGYQQFNPTQPQPGLTAANLDPQYLAALKARFQNQGPSFAQTAFNQNAAEQQARIAATAGAQGGQLPGMAQREAATAMATAGTNTAAQAAQLKAQESQANQAAYGGALGQQAGLTLQNNQQQQDQYQFLQQFLANQANLKNQTLTGYQTALNNDAISQQNAEVNGAFGGASALAGGAATLGKAAIAASDENMKENVRPGHIDARKFMDALKAHSYNYKPGSGEDPGPTHLGVMAQDMEKAAPGAVEEGPHGKQIDYGQLAGTFAASLSDLHERMKALEAKKGKK